MLVFNPIKHEMPYCETINILHAQNVQGTIEIQLNINRFTKAVL